jgi:hypothetical protein
MQDEAGSDWFVVGMMSVFGLIGLVLAIGARDSEIFIFGASLAAFAAVFDASILQRRFRARAIAKELTSHG